MPGSLDFFIGLHFELVSRLKFAVASFFLDFALVFSFDFFLCHSTWPWFLFSLSSHVCGSELLPQALDLGGVFFWVSTQICFCFGSWAWGDPFSFSWSKNPRLVSGACGPRLSLARIQDKAYRPRDVCKGMDGMDAAPPWDILNIDLNRMVAKLQLVF